MRTTADSNRVWMGWVVMDSCQLITVTALSAPTPRISHNDRAKTTPHPGWPLSRRMGRRQAGSVDSGARRFRHPRSLDTTPNEKCGVQPHTPACHPPTSLTTLHTGRRWVAYPAWTPAARPAPRPPRSRRRPPPAVCRPATRPARRHNSAAWSASSGARPSPHPRSRSRRRPDVRRRFLPEQGLARCHIKQRNRVFFKHLEAGLVVPDDFPVRRPGCKQVSARQPQRHIGRGETRLEPAPHHARPGIPHPGSPIVPVYHCDLLAIRRPRARTRHPIYPPQFLSRSCFPDDRRRPGCGQDVVPIWRESRSLVLVQVTRRVGQWLKGIGGIQVERVRRPADDRPLRPPQQPAPQPIIRQWATPVFLYDGPGSGVQPHIDVIGRVALNPQQRSEAHTSELQSPTNIVCR